MWCGTCQSDVVTEVASDHRRVSCSICGATLGETAASQYPAEGSSPRSAKTTQAKELLDRWAKSPLFDPYGPARTGHETAAPAAARPTATKAAPQPMARQHSDTHHETATTPAAADSVHTAPAATEPAYSEKAEELDRLTEEILSRVARITDSIRTPAVSGSTRVFENHGTDDRATSANPNSRQSATSSEVESTMSETSPDSAWRVDSSHAPPSETSKSFDAAGNPVSAGSDRVAASEPVPDRTVPTQASIPAPHAELTQPVPASLSNSPQKPGFVGGIGQVLAYLGILGLTAGTSLVIVGYFGGPAHYAPTGWLITTIGQMMLFLGVVTLVSTGMEQTQAEVRESLDETLREVSSRIDQLGQRLTRIDASAHETPPAPHSLTRTPADTGVSRQNSQ